MTDAEESFLKLPAGDTRAIRIGSEVLYPPVMVGGKAFQFNAYQNGFLYALQQSNGDIKQACKAISKKESWAYAFMSTAKFRAFRQAKLQCLAIKAGDLVDWWWEMGLDGARGVRQWYEAPCPICKEDNKYSVLEAESSRQDDMSFKALCKVCMQAVELDFKEEKFTPSREQVQFWSELGNRMVPKIERVQHEFSKENFIFETETA